MLRLSKFGRLPLVAFVALMALTALPVSGQTSRGEKSFGIRGGFVSRNTSATAGLQFTYAFSRHVRIAPSADVYFRHNNLDALAISVDMHFPVAMSAKSAFYPIAGAAYTSWGRHNIADESMKDVTSHTNGLGLNVGAGVDFRTSESVRICLEARYTLMQHLPTAIVAVGFGYVF